MFVGMVLCLVGYEIYKVLSPKLKKASVTHKKVYYITMAPATFDLLGTALMNIGLLWIPASIWQMLRGSMVVFSAFLSVCFLKRTLYGYHWFGVFIVVCALVLVGVACIKGESSSHGMGHELTGIFLVVGAQVIQSCQVIVEDHLLHSVKVNPFLIVGLEGLWGSIFTIGIFLPIIGNTPKRWGPGLHEDTIDSLVMLRNGDLLGLNIGYVLTKFFYNIFGMFVTNTFTAVHRTILETVRTFCIWVTDLIIHYGITKKNGEKWDNWSWMQLGGFLLLMFGMFIYNKGVQLPGFTYPDIKKDKEDETISLLQEDENTDSNSGRGLSSN
ncbi:solute carrier family 35 member f6 [Anaeramoeba flamelloides]|uniref:Solute carrier family 35 member f6 n=1 Tax=Anaeramoeba flamelloides TaxID=1746091 RepID=A0AAV7ZXQ1_9EUKA|nr:solute carrier family 35 member f6 [Anaeramoeba flamelloides]